MRRVVGLIVIDTPEFWTWLRFVREYIQQRVVWAVQAKRYSQHASCQQLPM